MTFDVWFAKDAAEDLREIYMYIREHDSAESAKYVIGEIRKAVDSLYMTPQMGGVPKELVSVGIKDFREVFFKPYRIIYQVVDKSVYIMLVADGRRDMRTILEKRLFRA